MCRNPDGDKSPWCYTLSDSAISWEYCDIPSCQMPLSEFVSQHNEEDRNMLTYIIMWSVSAFRILTSHSFQIYSLLLLFICDFTSDCFAYWSNSTISLQ